MAGYEAQHVARRRGLSLDMRFSAILVALAHLLHLAEAQVGWQELLPGGIPPAERDKQARGRVVRQGQRLLRLRRRRPNSQPGPRG